MSDYSLLLIPDIKTEITDSAFEVACKLRPGTLCPPVGLDFMCLTTCEPTSHMMKRIESDNGNKQSMEVQLCWKLKFHVFLSSSLEGFLICTKKIDRAQSHSHSRIRSNCFSAAKARKLGQDWGYLHKLRINAMIVKNIATFRSLCSSSNPIFHEIRASTKR